MELVRPAHSITASQHALLHLLITQQRSVKLYHIHRQHATQLRPCMGPRVLICTVVSVGVGVGVGVGVVVEALELLVSVT